MDASEHVLHPDGELQAPSPDDELLPTLYAVAAAAHDIASHFEKDGHPADLESDCCKCWAVARLREALGTFNLALLERKADAGP